MGLWLAANQHHATGDAIQAEQGTQRFRTTGTDQTEQAEDFTTTQRQGGVRGFGFAGDAT